MSITAVAKRAGVSVATVSRVLNGMPVVREATAQQVKEAIAALGYQPARVRPGPKRARRDNPVGLKHGQIAVLSIGHEQNWLQMPVLASVVTGISRACRDNHVKLLLDGIPDIEKPSQLIRRQEVDGVIAFIRHGVDHQFLLDMKRQVPLVWAMGSEDGHAGIDHVTADNVGVGRLACRYLLSQGCRHLAVLCTQMHWPFVRTRARAFIETAFENGTSARGFLVPGDGRGLSAGQADQCFDSLEQAVVSLAATQPRIDGLFIPTDLQTVQVYPLLQRHGITPQKDLKIVSCDNEQVRLNSLHPTPPSVELGVEDIGKAAYRQLMNRILEPASPCVRVQVSPRIDGWSECI